MNTLVSVIIPIYNVEPYLRRCLDSIIDQTYSNLEIILVDDGSPDGCPQICDEYAGMDNRIVVIHKENGGLSDARNAGLDICKGDYITFVDSDDWVNEKYIEVMLDSALKYDAGVVISNYELVYDDNHREQNVIVESPMEILTSVQAVKRLFSPNEVLYVIACAKLFARSIFNEIRFPKGKLNEDEYVAHLFLYNSQKTVVLKRILYYYFQRAGSITATIEKNSLRILEARIDRCKFFSLKKEKDILELCLKPLCWDLLFAYAQTCEGKKVPVFSSCQEILNLYRKCASDYFFVGRKTLDKLIIWLFSFWPQLYLFYRKFSPYTIRKS